MTRLSGTELGVYVREHLLWLTTMYTYGSAWVYTVDDIGHKCF